jgi:hypothetical protein
MAIQHETVVRTAIRRRMPRRSRTEDAAVSEHRAANWGQITVLQRDFNDVIAIWRVGAVPYSRRPGPCGVDRLVDNLVVRAIQRIGNRRDRQRGVKRDVEANLALGRRRRGDDVEDLRWR